MVVILNILPTLANAPFFMNLFIVSFLIDLGPSKYLD
jgi:hypothetical protein